MENRKYEVLVLLDAKADEASRAELITKIEKKIGGNIVKKEDWGVKTLAYEIKKRKEAHYVLYYVETTPEAIKEYKEYSLITKGILREMILVHDKKWPFEMKTSKDLTFPERKPRNNKFNKNEETGAEKVAEAKVEQPKTEEVA